MPADPDLDRLTAAERAILALLAQGHTAKSIAAETGRTEGAVNERLREARRKTGVGSSRELARLVRAQENRDEDIGMAPGPEPRPAPARAPHRPRWQGALLMTLPVALLAAAAALHFSAPQADPVPPTPPAPPGSTAPPGAEAEAARWRATFAAEPRDPAWAGEAEAALERRYHAVGGADLATLTVTCRTTLCDVRGQAVSKVATGAGKRLVDTLGSRAFRSSVPGLHADVTNVSSFTRDSSYVISFDALWRRTGPG